MHVLPAVHVQKVNIVTSVVVAALTVQLDPSARAVVLSRAPQEHIKQALAKTTATTVVLVTNAQEQATLLEQVALLAVTPRVQLLLLVLMLQLVTTFLVLALRVKHHVLVALTNHQQAKHLALTAPLESTSHGLDKRRVSMRDLATSLQFQANVLAVFVLVASTVLAQPTLVALTAQRVNTQLAHRILLVQVPVLDTTPLRINVAKSQQVLDITLLQVPRLRQPVRVANSLLQLGKLVAHSAMLGIINRVLVKQVVLPLLLQVIMFPQLVNAGKQFARVVITHQQQVRAVVPLATLARINRIKVELVVQLPLPDIMSQQQASVVRQQRMQVTEQVLVRVLRLLVLAALTLQQQDILLAPSVLLERIPILHLPPRAVSTLV
jgi:hypothetical protein